MEGAWIAAASALWVIWIAGLLVFRRRPELHAGTLREFVYPVAALAIGLIWFFSPPTAPWSAFLALYMRALVVIVLFLTAVWLLSLYLRDCGIMDVVYAPTAALPLLVLLAERGTWSPPELLMAGMLLLWSCRMALHVGIRNAAHHAEDGRYAAWRRRFGGNWWWWSYFHVFLIQGVTVWLWVLPLIVATSAGPRNLGWPHALAVALFALGFFFQVVSDLQLERFKRERTDRSKVLDTGLWSLSRHPNYFGEAVIWWSYGALALTQPWGWLTLVFPAYVTWFMSAGSATPMQERYLAKTKPAYAQYMRRVPTFVPWTKP